MSLLSKHLEPINRELKKKVLGPKQMNERIEQMMLEATKDMPQGYYVPGEYFQKFAELIIRECVSICEKDGQWYTNTGWLAEAGEALSLSEQIKEHFRVK